MNSNPTITVVGLGYVGLPLAIEFGKYFPTYGFDIDNLRIDAIGECTDVTGVMTSEEIEASTYFEPTSDREKIRNSTYYIITVPTPVTKDNRPDLSHLEAASSMVGSVMSKGAIVIYESTVYPGATEEACVPILEAASDLKWKVDFNVGYSPERINPSDKENTLINIIKLVAGDTSETLKKVTELYSKIIQAGVFPVKSIAIAEAAKAIENTQRDINIALMNELSMICDRLEIPTLDVIDAASTKWNFSPYFPGLVGGHCIGVDPYYLTHKAQTLGYNPKIILAGRSLNQNMPIFVAEKIARLMRGAGMELSGARINVFGLTFKENCPDIRNSRVPELVTLLRAQGAIVRVHDPLAQSSETLREYGLELSPLGSMFNKAVSIIAVPHHRYVSGSPDDIHDILLDSLGIVDIRGICRHENFTNAKFFWCL